MTITDGPESEMSLELNLYVIEFQSINIVVGFTLPNGVKIEQDINSYLLLNLQLRRMQKMLNSS